MVIEDLTGSSILPYYVEKGSCGEMPLRYLRDGKNLAYCATRRSAGLPLFIQVNMFVISIKLGLGKSSLFVESSKHFVKTFALV